MNGFKREVKLGEDVSAFIYYRRPSIDEREQFSIKQQLVMKLLADNPDNIEIMNAAIKEMSEYSYSVGQDIIIRVHCDEWPEWCRKLMDKEELDEQEFIVKYCFDEIMDLGRTIVGGQTRNLSSEESKQAVQFAKDFLNKKKIEAEEVKN